MAALHRLEPICQRLRACRGAGSEASHRERESREGTHPRGATDLASHACVHCILLLRGLFESMYMRDVFSMAESHRLTQNGRFPRAARFWLWQKPGNRYKRIAGKKRMIVVVGKIPCLRPNS
jgi:hypothetical protein